MGGRRLLVIGFGGVLLLTLLTGALAIWDGSRYHAGARDLRRQSEERSGALRRIRESVLLSALDPGQAEALRSRTTVDIALLSRSGDSQPLAELRTDVGNYWDVLALQADITPRERRKAVDDYFRGTLARSRQAMLAVSDCAGELLRAETRNQEGELAEMFRTSRRRTVVCLALALPAGLALACLTSAACWHRSGTPRFTAPTSPHSAPVWSKCRRRSAAPSPANCTMESAKRWRRCCSRISCPGSGHWPNRAWAASASWR